MDTNFIVNNKSRKLLKKFIQHWLLWSTCSSLYHLNPTYFPSDRGKKQTNKPTVFTSVDQRQSHESLLHNSWPRKQQPLSSDKFHSRVSIRSGSARPKSAKPANIWPRPGLVSYRIIRLFRFFGIFKKYFIIVISIMY